MRQESGITSRTGHGYIEQHVDIQSAVELLQAMPQHEHKKELASGLSPTETNWNSFNTNFSDIHSRYAINHFLNHQHTNQHNNLTIHNGKITANIGIFVSPGVSGAAADRNTNNFTSAFTSSSKLLMSPDDAAKCRGVSLGR